MQALINELVEKANLSPEAATKAVDVTISFVKSKLPPFLADKVEELIGGKFDLGAMMGGLAGGAKDEDESPLDKLNGMFGDKK